MRDERVIFQVTRRGLVRALLAVLLLGVIALSALPLRAQRSQEEYGDKFKIADETGGVAIATSADGRYVYVAGRKGIIVSDDHGKTGSWVQTVRMK